MFFSTKSHKVHKNSKISLKILSQTIKEVTEFKFLGILISNNLSWQPHMQQVLNKLRACLAKLFINRDTIARAFVYSRYSIYLPTII